MIISILYELFCDFIFFLVTLAHGLCVCFFNGIDITDYQKNNKLMLQVGLGFFVIAIIQRLILYRIFPYDALIAQSYIIFSGYWVNGKQKLKAVVAYLFMTLVLTLGELAAAFCVESLFQMNLAETKGNSRNWTNFNLLLFSLFFLFTLILILIVLVTIKRYKKNITSQQSILFRSFISIFILCFYWVLVLSNTIDILADKPNGVIMFFSFIIILNTLLFFNYLHTNLRHYQYYKKNQSLSQQIEVANMLVGELRQFKNSYLNSLYGFGYYSAKMNSEELSDYYHQVISLSKMINNDNIISIQKVNNSALVNLFNKHMRLYSQDNIPFTLNVQAPITSFHVKDADLYNTLDIYLNNARMDTRSTPSPYVKLDIITTDQWIEFILYHTSTSNNVISSSSRSIPLKKNKHTIQNIFEQNNMRVQQLIILN